MARGNWKNYGDESSWRARSRSQKHLTTGIEEIDRRLETLAVREANKIVRAAVTSGLRVLAAAIKSEAGSDGTFPQDSRSKKDGHRSVAKSLQETVGQRFRSTTKGKQEVSAKAGFGVAKKSPRGDANGQRPGVGLVARDAHWFGLGTQRRETGSKASSIGGLRVRVRTGNPVSNRGQLKQVNAVSRAASSLNKVAETIERKAREKIEEAVIRLASVKK